jgi:hypothetical protein
VTGDQIEDLPDVHLDEATADDESNHGADPTGSDDRLTPHHPILAS